MPAGDIRAGAFALAAGYRYFTKGTIHVAVVDPGVGSKRQAIAVQTADYLFVGPDNGVLSFALRRERIKSVRAIENNAWFLHPLSRTFHGRDVFSPVAAHISRGVPLQELGPVLNDFKRLNWPEPRRKKGRLEGEVIYIDRFGNAITNLTTEALTSFQSGRCDVHANQPHLVPLQNHYQAVRPGKPVAVPGSSGLLEIAINGGSAEDKLGLKIGTRIAIFPAKAK